MSEAWLRSLPSSLAFTVAFTHMRRRVCMSKFKDDKQQIYNIDREHKCEQVIEEPWLVWVECYGIKIYIMKLNYIELENM